MKRYRKLLRIAIASALVALGLVILSTVVVSRKSEGFIYEQVSGVPACYTGLVLGAKVSADGRPGNYLKERLDMAARLYQEGKITRLLLSGDHGQHSYDEVNGMKRYLVQQGIDSADIFLDHAGFDTYNSMYRARDVFQVDSLIIISQAFHLPRALYIARSLGLEAYGVAANTATYAADQKLRLRESLARVKAFAEVTVKRPPKFLGEPIPITGDSQKSYD